MISERTLKNIAVANLYDWGNHRTNYVHEKDPLNDFQESFGRAFELQEIGETIELVGDWWDNMVNGYLMDNMIDVLQDNDMDERHEKNGSDRIEDDSDDRIISPRYF